MTTGKILWTSHATGWWGQSLKLLDWLPAFTNELRDTPHHVSGNEVYCHSGRVVDLLTGIDLRRVSSDEVRQFRNPHSEASRLYYGKLQYVRTKIVVGLNRFLSHKKSDQDFSTEGFRLYGLDESDTVLWEFDIRDTGLVIDGNFFSYRFVAGEDQSHFVYLVASEEPNRIRRPLSMHWVNNPTHYHLLSLDVSNGRIVRDTRIEADRVNACRIEDVDDGGILISLNESRLKYYERSSVTPQSP